MYYYRFDDGRVQASMRPLSGGTPIEQAEFDATVQAIHDAASQAPPAPTAEERLDALEAAIKEGLQL